MRLNAVISDGVIKLRALLDHPMESGRRNDSRGNEIDANYLREISVRLGDRVLLSSAIGANLSKNPYFSIEFEGGNAGDEIQVEWIDNLGESTVRNIVVESA